MTVVNHSSVAIVSSTFAEELSQRTPIATFRGLDIHTFTGDECPATMLEIGRLREIGFRAVGAGRGEALDLDSRDFGPHSYRQLVAWDPEHGELVALYRYQFGSRAQSIGPACLRTYGLFEYSATFRQHLLPFAIELGRSVVNREAKKGSLGFFATWVGLGTLLQQHPEVAYFFGNVSLYQTLDEKGRDLLVSVMHERYAPPESMLCARKDIAYHVHSHAPQWPTPDTNPEQRIRALREWLMPYSLAIPPILQSYMSLSTEIWCGETVYDADFGGALELGIIVPVKQIDARIKNRFMHPR